MIRSHFCDGVLRGFSGGGEALHRYVTLLRSQYFNINVEMDKNLMDIPVV